MRSFSKKILFTATGLLTALFLTLTSIEAWSAACCGGGFASPTVITGDEKATFSGELSYSNIATDVSSQGIWQNRATEEQLQTFKLQGAHIFLDRFQFGASLPVIRRTRQDMDSTGLGDLGLNLGYEILPEWDYSPWRPRGIAFLSLMAPTGRSIQDATTALQLDARGRGFWSIGLGTTLTKVIGKFDFNSTIEAHHSFAREVRNTLYEGELIPGFGGLVSLGSGYNIRDTRLGAQLSFNYEDAIETRGTITSPGAPTRFATASLVASQMLDEEWSVSLAFADQTLFGAPTNTSLAKSVSITALHRFSR